jgi:predicted dehydrogenase/threonine dehydrogenase-like Zn-dependent dehydrogenase
MLQISEDIHRGRVVISEQPAPLARLGHVLIANAASVISAGTEKMVIDFGRKSLLDKARERPDQVRRLWEKVRQEGLASAVRAAKARLDEPMAMGYASAGVVLEVGDGVQGFKPGDRVASNGPHAGVVCVPKNLCARVPDGVPLEHAAFTVLGAIALQGVRLSRAVLGETVLVIGLGLVGQLTVALLKTAGCRVVGTDPEGWKCELAVKMGAALARPELAAGDVAAATGGLGADAVIITASTKSKGPIDLAANAVRKKGRVVLVGVVGLELDRRPFYFKEAEFVVSCSYGPGRYDAEYEEGGRDYPAAYVRWTEQRNMQAVLELMAGGSLDVSPLITHRLPIKEAERAYELIERGEEPYLGIVLQYPAVEPDRLDRQIRLAAPKPTTGKTGIGVLGAGNFARTILLPALKSREELRPVALCSARGASATHYGPEFGFEVATTDENEVIRHPDVDAVFILTRHHQHARQVISAIEAGKHVFVEKPLCLTTEELAAIEQALRARPERTPLLMVGFNRRFAPGVQAVREFFAGVTEPLTLAIRFNAGDIPADHWTQDPETGGGRIIGEACHAIDLATFLTGSLPVRVFAESIGGPNAPEITDDQCFITLRHANGSVSSIGYLAGGSRACPKERLEVIGGGRVAQLEDFRRVILYSDRGRSTKGYQGYDKGHGAEIEAFVNAVRGRSVAPIPFEEIRAVSLAAILAVRSLREGQPQEIR